MTSRRRFVAATIAATRVRAQDSPYDVLVYGATPSGIAAACAAADDGRRVLLAEPTARIGGMVSCGLSHTDFRTFEGLNGFYFDLSRRSLAYYESKYGEGSEQARDSLYGTQCEPSVNLLMFERLLAERPRIAVRKNLRLDSVRREGLRIVSATISGTAFAANTFIDATYEGDLMAAAGVEYRVGREGRSEFGESLAPEKPDGQLQGYNFRLSATQVPENRVTPKKPAGYRRDDFAGVLPLLADGRIERIFGHPKDCIFKAQIPRLPNRKYDINDVSNCPVRLSLPGENLKWPEGDAPARRRIFDEHLLWHTGLLWFLQNDPAVPAKFRDEAREWGWCRDEFADSDHLPPQLYVREARRMRGLHIYTENDTAHAPGDARSILHRDAVAIGDYSHNCHGSAHEGPRFGGRHVGEFYKPIPPYQIPYGVVVPRDVENLLVPVAASSSHVGFCALRLEPIWMSMGQAAGHAAHLAAAEKIAVQRVPVDRLQRRLWSAGGATFYASDIPPGHADFALVQRWGTAGGFHGIAPKPSEPGSRGKNKLGQYHEAFLGHAVELEKPLDDALRATWEKLARELGAAPPAGMARTRGEWLRGMRA
ncbi:MAG: FAD-dependent oxidoreductase [Bryobacteraceae bacterium]|nr:FAD-dependent oxidoreductase [Bryobacteraceae bacterium]